MSWSSDGVDQMLADAGKLKQMLLNLVSNAIKFTPEGGTVIIGVKKANDSVEFSVADTGIGIAPADQTQIFKEFHQIDHGPGRKHEGTGLGLALTKRFAVLHGGDVRVVSSVEKGSTFTLSLPLRASAAPAGDGVQPAAKNGHGSGPLILVVSVVDNPELGLALGAIDYFVKPVEAKELIARLNLLRVKKPNGDGEVRVLIVDDEPANRQWLTKALEPAGFTVLAASGGREAIDMAKAEKPDLVILDLMMPEVTGFDVVEALRANESTRETPIMVLTASNLTEAD